MTANWIGGGYARMGRTAALCFLSLFTLTLLGCNYNRQTSEFHELYESGDYAQAASVVTDQADHAAPRDAVLYRLEQGAILRAAGQNAPSNEALNQADDLISNFDEEPDVRVSQEAIAAGVNQTALDYRGYAYDKIVMDTYKALNDLELGDMDRARVQFNRAYARQQEAVDKYTKQIAADKETRANNKSQYDTDQATNDPTFQQGLQQNYANLNVQNLSAYSNYVNPFTEYMRGLYLTCGGVDASDLEKGATALRRAAGLISDNVYIKQDAVMAEKVANGGHIDPTTYVVLEAGLAPARGEVKIQFPVFHNGQTDYIGAAFPILVFRPCNCDEAVIQTSAGSYTTAVVCDMDKVVAQEFKNELPLVITRTLISTAIKEGLEYAADQEQRQNNNTGSALLNFGTKLFVAATNQADTRTWKSLPKYFSIARFSTPADRQLSISIAGAAPVGVTLADGVVNVVYVKCVQLGAPVSIRQFKLK